MAVFAGLDGIDWAAMKHAYGSAEEVPALVRGLVAEDPAVRETALDGMYGAVHHQGDVYECTLAVVPFLLDAAGRPDLPGRGGVVELLASIGGADYYSDDAAGDADAAEGGDNLYRQAEAAVAAAHPLFLELLADADPSVRESACKALTVGRPAGAVVGHLQDRLAAEEDADVQTALVAAVGALGRRAAAGRAADVDPASVGAWLAALAAEHANPMLRLEAMSELARCAPDELPSDTVPAALEALSQVYTDGAPAPEPAGFSTETLVGMLREQQEREASGRRAPQAAALVRSLAHALGDRVEDRIQLLTALLRSPDWERRYDAIGPAQVLVGGWRGDYREVVSLIGTQLLDPAPRLSLAAAKALEGFFELAAPAADDLARGLGAAPRHAFGTEHDGPPPWVTLWPNEPPRIGPALTALARVGDPRALPMLRWVLEQEDVPVDTGHVVRSMGAAAADLVPEIRRHLHDPPDERDRHWRRDALMWALGDIGPAALPAVPDLVQLAPAGRTVWSLGDIGPGAAEAVPVLRSLLDHSDLWTSIAAARALWLIDSDAERVLPVIARHLDGGEHAEDAAFVALSWLGAAAAPLEPRLRSILDRSADGRRVLPAMALWRATGDTETALPVLLADCAECPSTGVVNCLAEMGPAAAFAAPLLRAELGRRQRHNLRAGIHSSADVRDDEELRRACTAALAAVTAER